MDPHLSCGSTCPSSHDSNMEHATISLVEGHKEGNYLVGSSIDFDSSLQSFCPIIYNNNRHGSSS